MSSYNLKGTLGLNADITIGNIHGGQGLSANLGAAGQALKGVTGAAYSTYRGINSLYLTMDRISKMVGRLIKPLDDLTSVVSRTKAAFKDVGKEYSTTQIMANSRLAANQAYTNLNTMGSMIARLGFVKPELGLGGATGIASTIMKSGYLGGTQPQELRSTVLQLLQGIGSNQLGGDELRSLRENAPGLVKYLSAGLRKLAQENPELYGNFENANAGNIKQLGEQKLLTSDVVIKALNEIKDVVDRDFKTLTPTMEMSKEVIGNEIMNTLFDNGFADFLNPVKDLITDVGSYIQQDGNMITSTIQHASSILEHILYSVRPILDAAGTIVSLLATALDNPIGSWAINTAMARGILGAANNAIFGKRKVADELSDSASGVLKTVTFNNGNFQSAYFANTNLGSILSAALGGVTGSRRRTHISPEFFDNGLTGLPYNDYRLEQHRQLGLPMGGFVGPYSTDPISNRELNTTRYGYHPSETPLLSGPTRLGLPGIDMYGNRVGFGESDIIDAEFREVSTNQLAVAENMQADTSGNLKNTSKIGGDTGQIKGGVAQTVSGIFSLINIASAILGAIGALAGAIAANTAALKSYGSSSSNTLDAIEKANSFIGSGITDKSITKEAAQALQQSMTPSTLKDIFDYAKISEAEAKTIASGFGFSAFKGTSGYVIGKLPGYDTLDFKSTIDRAILEGGINGNVQNGLNYGAYVKNAGGVNVLSYDEWNANKNFSNTEQGRFLSTLRSTILSPEKVNGYIDFLRQNERQQLFDTLDQISANTGAAAASAGSMDSQMKNSDFKQLIDYMANVTQWYANKNMVGANQVHIGNVTVDVRTGAATVEGVWEDTAKAIETAIENNVYIVDNTISPFAPVH